jgi:hypothetical protein
MKTIAKFSDDTLAWAPHLVKNGDRSFAARSVYGLLKVVTVHHGRVMFFVDEEYRNRKSTIVLSRRQCIRLGKILSNLPPSKLF